MINIPRIKEITACFRSSLDIFYLALKSINAFPVGDPTFVQLIIMFVPFTDTTPCVDVVPSPGP